MGKSHIPRATRTFLGLVAVAGLTLVGSACSGNDGGNDGGLNDGGVNDGGVNDGEESPECAGASFDGFEGSAHLETTGDLQMTADLCVLIAAGIETDLGAFTFTWQGEGGLPSLTVLGPIETGTHRTSSTPPMPIVTIVLEDDPSAAAFVSNDGTCSVTVDSVDATAVSGTLSCSDLATSDASATIGAQGTFLASRA